MCGHIWKQRPRSSCDGLIFMKLLNPYSIFRSSMTNVLKWKPKEKITIDFFVKRRNACDIMDFVKGMPFTYKIQEGNASLRVCTKSGRLLLISFAYCSEDGIWEFSWNGKLWHPEKQRHDKKGPNTIETVVKTIRSIGDALSIDDLSLT